MEYFKADDEMVAICKDMVEKHHQHLTHCKIALICRDKASTRSGKTELAYASKPSKQLRPLLDDNYHFVITISADTWQALDDAQRAALLDHELCHCELDPDGEPVLIGHDYEEFAAIIERHGFWRNDFGEEKVSQALLFTETRQAHVKAPNLKLTRKEAS